MAYNYRYYLSVPRGNQKIEFECFPKMNSGNMKITYQEQSGEAWYTVKINSLIFTGERNSAAPDMSDFDSIIATPIFAEMTFIVRSKHDEYLSDFEVFTFTRNDGTYDEKLKTLEISVETTNPSQLFSKKRDKEIDLYSYTSSVSVSTQVKAKLFCFVHSSPTKVYPPIDIKNSQYIDETSEYYEGGGNTTYIYDIHLYGIMTSDTQVSSEWEYIDELTFGDPTTSITLKKWTKKPSDPFLSMMNFGMGTVVYYLQPSTDPDHVLIHEQPYLSGKMYIYTVESIRAGFDTWIYIQFPPARHFFSTLDFCLKSLGLAGLRSKFFSDDVNYVTGETNVLKNLLVWDRSDIKRPFADEKATTCIIEIGKLIDTLKAMFWLKWVVDTENYLVLEHISYFDTDIEMIDLRPIETIEKTAKYSYQKTDIPKYAKYEFAEGNNNKSYVTRYDQKATDKDTTESINADAVVTDINDILTNADSFSDDGLVFGIYAHLSETQNYIMHEDHLLWPSLVQNYGLHNRYQPTFWGGANNETAYTAKSLVRTKKQKPVFSILQKLGKKFTPSKQGFQTYMHETSANDADRVGKVESAELNLDTDIITLNLKYTPI